MSYIDIYDDVRKHWEADSGDANVAGPQISLKDFKLSGNLLSATVGGVTKTVDLSPIIPRIPPDLRLKSVTPSADNSKLIFKIGEAGSTTRDQIIETDLKEQVVKLIGASATPYNDAELKRRIAALEAAQQNGGGTNPFKEYEAKYISKEALGNFANNAFVPITFSKTFSTVPFVTITLDLQATQPRITYLANITESGFQFATNYSGDVKGIWYQAYVVG